MAHHFILLRFNPFGLRVDREGWWFERSMSWLRVCLSAEGAKNVSWPWLSPLRGWGSLTMTFTSKFVYIYIYIYIYIFIIFMSELRPSSGIFLLLVFRNRSTLLLHKRKPRLKNMRSYPDKRAIRIQVTKINGKQ